MAYPADIDDIPPANDDDDPLGVDHPDHHDMLRAGLIAVRGVLGTDDAPGVPRSAGVAGGQTLIGGTGAGDALTLQGTSASGTTPTATALIVLTGDSGNTQALAITNAGRVSITAGLSSAAIGIGNNPGEYWQLQSGAPAVIAQANLGVTATPINNANDVTAAGSTCFINNTGNNSRKYNGGSFNTASLTTNVGTIGSMRGFAASCKHEGPGNVTLLYGAVLSAYNYSAATITYQFGLASSVYNYVAGTVTNQFGLSADVQNVSTGTVAKMYGVSVKLTSATGGTVTNAYGIAFGIDSAWVGSGAVTNCYVIGIASSTNIGTNKWAIWSASAAQSYLEGSLGIGVTIPSAKVHSLATTEQLRLGYDAANCASFTVSSAGVLTLTTTGTAPALLLMGDVRLDKTITAAGTNGAQTINKNIGSVNFAIAATSLVVTDSRVTVNSVIVATVATNDTTMKSVSAVAADGSFTLYANAAPTAATRVNFIVFN